MLKNFDAKGMLVLRRGREGKLGFRKNLRDLEDLGTKAGGVGNLRGAGRIYRDTGCMFSDTDG
ncbi:MAG: hypothetical protein LZF60_190011 [Nitrospira sp.]|nr:MAG: hypothetical protein LZF60_190011 [Nitrospira sp.]